MVSPFELVVLRRPILSFLMLPGQRAPSSTWNKARKTLSNVSARLKTFTGTEAATSVEDSVIIELKMEEKVAAIFAPPPKRSALSVPPARAQSSCFLFAVSDKKYEVTD